MIPNFKPMLAGKVEDVADLEFPLYASPKLDGIRAHVIDGAVYSRNMKMFPNADLQAVFGVRELHGIDGELIYGSPTDPAAFRRTGSNVMSHDGDISQMYFHVFDDFTLPTVEFQHRLRTAHERVKSFKLFSPVQHTLISSAEELIKYEARAVEKGYEGVMVRSLDGPYKFGRSTAREGWLLKLKRFEDGEAVIDDVQEFQHNENERGEDGKRSSHKAGKRAGGKLGAIVVRDIKSGVQFNIGSGFTDAERVNLWANYQNNPANLIGVVVKYKFFPTGSKDKPRFPTFEGFRDRIDI